MSEGDKAELLAETFASRATLPARTANEYTAIAATPEVQSGLFIVRTRNAKRVLQRLRLDSATGPDLLPAKVLKHCAVELAQPVAALARAILQFGVWPDSWRTHWVVPIHKRKAKADPANYRGVHLTSQLSKVMERLPGNFFLPFLSRTGAFGPNQFAYTKGRGTRDALACNASWWIHCVAHGKKLVLYCSNVAVAF